MSGVAVLIGAVLGAVFGSFLGVVVARVPSGTSVRGRSACDRCARPLRSSDLVPVASWLWLRGRCRSCHSRIPARWLVLEIASAALIAGAVNTYPTLAQAATAGALLCVLLSLSIIDLEHQRLPNEIVLLSVAVALAAILTADIGLGQMSLVAGLVGAVGYGGALLTLRTLSRGGMGLGDVKLACLIGLVVGAIHLPSVAVAAGAAITLGGLAAIVALARGAHRKSALPFGPMLAAGAAIAIFWGPELADAYLGLFR